MTGCAGGLSGGLWAVHRAVLEPGAPWVLDALDFDRRMRGARAVVTGEGRLDEQTLAGKAVFEVATRSRQAGVPCYAVVGTDALDAFEKRLVNIEVEQASRGAAQAGEREVELAAARLAKPLLGS
jgi:glycerate kinase